MSNVLIFEEVFETKLDLHISDFTPLNFSIKNSNMRTDPLLFIHNHIYTDFHKSAQ